MKKPIGPWLARPQITLFCRNKGLSQIILHVFLMTVLAVAKCRYFWRQRIVEARTSATNLVN